MGASLCVKLHFCHGCSCDSHFYVEPIVDNVTGNSLGTCTTISCRTSPSPRSHFWISISTKVFIIRSTRVGSIATGASASFLWIFQMMRARGVRGRQGLENLGSNSLSQPWMQQKMFSPKQTHNSQALIFIRWVCICRHVTKIPNIAFHTMLNCRGKESSWVLEIICRNFTPCLLSFGWLTGM